MNMNHLFLIGVVLLSSVIYTTLATRGVDVSTYVSKAKWRCIKKAGYKFAIVRVYQSTGRVDPNGAQTIKNARAVGIRYVDGYIFPCKRCGNPRRQVRNAINNLRRKGAKIGQLWLDVEGPQFWSNSKRSNIKFIQQMVAEARRLRVVVAIYTSSSQWIPITGNSKAFRNLQLWYAHYDNEPNFKDFRSFGGWRKPTIKQYVGSTSVCRVTVDKNWYP